MIKESVEVFEDTVGNIRIIDHSWPGKAVILSKQQAVAMLEMVQKVLDSGN